MTIVGKILVFINLVFSLLLGYFVIQVHQASQRWEKSNQDMQKALATSVASEKAFRLQNKALLDDKAEVAAKLKAKGVSENDSVAAVVEHLYTQVDNLTASVETRDKRLVQLGEALAEKDGELKKLKEVVKLTEEEVARRETDYEKLRKTLFELQSQATKLIDAKNNAERGEAQAKIERNNALDRATQLEKQVQQLSEDLVRVKSNTQTVATVTSLSGKNPPTTRVEGKVLRVEDGLIKLNVGSDRGLKEGHTLEVFRLSNTPGASRYLGTLRIMKVDPYESVGQMMSKPLDQVRVGDEVAPTTSFR